MKKTLIGLPGLWIGLCIAVLGFRATLGVDLGDESYYAAFVDGWLKNGLGNNPNLMIHQTANLVVYPLAVAYRAIRGDSDGLVLFLRLVYVGIAGLAACCLYRALALLQGRIAAVLPTFFVLLFVPFSLPAPSYNTVGMYSLIGALALFAVSFAKPLVHGARDEAVAAMNPLWLSAAWWTIACVAYPPMLVPLLALILVAPAVLRSGASRRRLFQYAVACGMLLALALVVLSFALGPSHLVEMVRFTNAFNNVSGGLGGKANAAIVAFQGHPRFAIMCVAALLISGLRCASLSRLAFFPEIATAALIVAVATSEAPVFYSRSHDLVLLLALTGCCSALLHLMPSNLDSQSRLLAVLYVISLIAGMTTATTAFNGLFNFPIGGCLAACLALVMEPPLASRDRLSTPGVIFIRSSVLALACAALAFTTFTSYYGQIGSFSYRASVRVAHGAFAGLRTDADQASFIDQVSLELKAQSNCGGRIAVFGTGPGFYLMTTMPPTTLSTWNLTGNVHNFAAEAFESFYSIRANQPNVLVVNNWHWATPLSDFERALLGQYVLAKRVVVGIRDASIYRRPECAPSNPMGAK